MSMGFIKKNVIKKGAKNYIIIKEFLLLIIQTDSNLNSCLLSLINNPNILKYIKSNKIIV